MGVWKNLSQMPESMDWLSLLKPWFPGNIILPSKVLKKGEKVSVFVSDGNMDEFCFLCSWLVSFFHLKLLSGRDYSIGNAFTLHT